MTTIASLRLRYFPFPGRAGPIRDALNIGRVEFEDEHIPPEEFGQRRAAGEFPFGGLPVLDVETTQGTVCSAQSNAILRFAGRLAGLYPVNNPVQALKVDEVLDFGEDINHLLEPSLREQDETKRMAMRKELAEQGLPFWLGCFERLLESNGNTGFIVGDRLSIADLKLYWVMTWLTSGMLDGIPPTLLDGYPSLMAWRKKVAAARDSRLAEMV